MDKNDAVHVKKLINRSQSLSCTVSLKLIFIVFVFNVDILRPTFLVGQIS